MPAEHDPREWPGPKAWPATLALISFFAACVFGQAFIKELIDAGVGVPDPLQPPGSGPQGLDLSALAGAFSGSKK